jgi:hypothetical protein
MFFKEWEQSDWIVPTGRNMVTLSGRGGINW